MVAMMERGPAAARIDSRHTKQGRAPESGWYSPLMVVMMENRCSVEPLIHIMKQSMATCRAAGWQGCRGRRFGGREGGQVRGCSVCGGQVRGCSVWVGAGDGHAARVAASMAGVQRRRETRREHVGAERASRQQARLRCAATRARPARPQPPTQGTRHHHPPTCFSGAVACACSSSWRLASGSLLERAAPLLPSPCSVAAEYGTSRALRQLRPRVAAARCLTSAARRPGASPLWRPPGRSRAGLPPAASLSLLSRPLPPSTS